MIEKEIEIKEYHQNGTLWYIEKRAIIYPLFFDAYKLNSMFRITDGVGYIKVECTKWYDNGQKAWSLKFNEKGEQINKEHQYRNDGTIIQY